MLTHAHLKDTVVVLLSSTTLRRIADQTMLLRLVCTLIRSRIDYCNLVLTDLPQSALAPLQRVMNAAVRLLAGLWQRDHVTESMNALHWLPVQDKIKLN